MRYLSVCSGIEAASVAWHHLGWEPVGFSEIEPFPAAVLAHRFPNVPNYGDMTKFQEWPIEPGTIDVLVGGTPCQSFSVAGLRKGLEDPRGNLMLTYLAIAARFKPRWVVWENVPGVLSSNGGRDFGTFLGALGELGYGWAYRVLDAQYVRVGRWPRAVPQRRRRVFVVGCLTDGAAAAEVLALREGLQRHIEASAKARKGAAPDAEGGARGGCWWDGGQVSQKLDAVLSKGQTMPEKNRFPAVLQPTEVSGTIAARFGQSRNNHEECVVQPTAGTLGNRGLRSHTELDGHGAYIPVAFSQNQREEVREVEVPGALAAEPGTHQQTYIAQPVPYDLFQITAPVNRQNRKPGDPCHTLARDNAAHAAVAFTVDMQACKGNANVGDGSVSPTLCKPSGNDVHAVAFQQNQLGEVRCNTVAGTVNTNSNPSGRNTPMVAIGTDCYNGAVTGDVAATMGTPGSSVNASGPTVMTFKPGQSAAARSIGAQENVACTLEAGGGGNNKQAVAFHPLQDPISSTDGSTHCMGTGGSQGHASIAVPVAPSLTATNDPSRSPQSSEVTQQVAAVHASTMTVRRLSARECERLQGFPDDWTLIPWRGKPAEQCPDGPRYKALGNSMACNCMAWIGERIAAWEAAR